jgi:hypothetical protein
MAYAQSLYKYADRAGGPGAESDARPRKAARMCGLGSRRRGREKNERTLSLARGAPWENWLLFGVRSCDVTSLWAIT